MTARRTEPDERLNGTEVIAQSPAADGARRAPSSTRFHAPPEAPRSREQAEAQYVAARTVWVDAMHKAASGRPADLASLAIAQEAYERAAVERARWEHGPRASIAVEPEPKRVLDVAIGQELAWRRVKEAEGRRRGLVGRLFGRRSRD